MSSQDRVCKICRREGDKLFLKGARCFTSKCSFERRSYAPGVHGQKMKRKPSEYALRLREKQRARRFYGLSERQFQNYFWRASKISGVTGERFLQLLESRLDNIVFRLGLAVSRRQARQLVGHGHIRVNQKKVDIPSYLVRPGDAVEVQDRSRETLSKIVESQGDRTVPDWLSFSKEALSGKVLALPNLDQVDAPIQVQYIVEHYA